MCTRFGLLTHSYLNVLTHPNCNSVHMPKKDKATEACGFSTHWKQECGRGGEGVKQSINLADVIRREKFLPAPATARCRSVNYGRDMWQRNLGTKKQGTWAMQNIDATQLWLRYPSVRLRRTSTRPDAGSHAFHATFHNNN